MSITQPFELIYRKKYKLRRNVPIWEHENNQTTKRKRIFRVALFRIVFTSKILTIVYIPHFVINRNTDLLINWPSHCSGGAQPADPKISSVSKSWKSDITTLFGWSDPFFHLIFLLPALCTLIKMLLCLVSIVSSSS